MKIKRLLPLLLIQIACNSVSSPVVPIPHPLPSVTPIPLPMPSPKPSPSPSSSVGVAYTGPEDFRTYIQAFHDDGVKQGLVPPLDNLSMQFGDLSQWGPNVIGLCQLGPQYRRVTVNFKWWGMSDDVQHNLLVHHELGHCSLSRPHLLDLFQDGTPVSIMYPIILSDEVYDNNLEHYQAELYLQEEIEIPFTSDNTKVFICPEP